MKRIPLRRRLRYRFDITFSKGTVTLIGWLFLVSLALVIVVSGFIVATGVDPQGRPFPQVLWASLMRALDPGTLGEDTGAWPFVLTMFGVALAGLLILGTLIGVLTTGIEGKLAELRKGRSFVAEAGHTVILGGSSHVHGIISELVTAYANQGGGCIAILARRDKVEMEDQIRERVGDTGRTRVICRSGDPIDMGDIDIVSPHSSRAILILPPETGNPDAEVIKSVLAIVNNPDRRTGSYHIVSAIQDPGNLAVAEIVGRGEAQFLLADEIAARVTAQVALQPGLSAVYAELMDFAGDEIYFQEEPALVGKTFGEALLAYEDSAVVGLRFHDGSVQLNPPMETVIARGDTIIAISQDDDTVKVSGVAAEGVDVGAVRQPAAEGEVGERDAPMRSLILGWNRRGSLVIRELDHYVAPGSTAMVVSEAPDAPGLGGACGADGSEAGTPMDLRHLRIEVRPACVTDRRTLDGLDMSSFDRVMVLSDARLDAQRADANTLITLLHLREIAREHDRRIPIVVEMLDVRNRELAEASDVEGLVVPVELIGLMMSQVAENRELMPVFQDLLNAEGSELYLKPIERYVPLGRAVSFYTVVQAARMRGEVALGYRLISRSRDRAAAYGVRLNPIKSEPVTFSPGDRVIVLAEA